MQCSEMRSDDAARRGRRAEPAAASRWRWVSRRRRPATGRTEGRSRREQAVPPGGARGWPPGRARPSTRRRSRSPGSATPPCGWPTSPRAGVAPRTLTSAPRRKAARRARYAPAPPRILRVERWRRARPPRGGHRRARCAPRADVPHREGAPRGPRRGRAAAVGAGILRDLDDVRLAIIDRTMTTLARRRALRLRTADATALAHALLSYRPGASRSPARPAAARRARRHSLARRGALTRSPARTTPQPSARRHASETFSISISISAATPLSAPLRRTHGPSPAVSEVASASPASSSRKRSTVGAIAPAWRARSGPRSRSPRPCA